MKSFVLALAVLAPLAQTPTQYAARPAGSLDEVRVVENNGRTEVVVRVAGEPRYRLFHRLGDPRDPRLTLEVLDANVAGLAARYPDVRRGGVRELRVTPTDSGTVQLAISLASGGRRAFGVVKRDGAIVVWMRNGAAPFQPWSSTAPKSTGLGTDIIATPPVVRPLSHTRAAMRLAAERQAAASGASGAAAANAVPAGDAAPAANALPAADEAPVGDAAIAAEVAPSAGPADEAAPSDGAAGASAPSVDLEAGAAIAAGEDRAPLSSLAARARAIAGRIADRTRNAAGHAAHALQAARPATTDVAIVAVLALVVFPVILRARRAALAPAVALQNEKSEGRRVALPRLARRAAHKASPRATPARKTASVRVSDPRIWAVQTLAAQGATHAEIARSTGLSRDAVTLIVRSATERPDAAGSAAGGTFFRPAPRSLRAGVAGFGVVKPLM